MPPSFRAVSVVALVCAAVAQGAGVASADALVTSARIHLDRQGRRHLLGAAAPRRRARHQRRARSGRRERRGPRHLLHDQHDDAPEPGRADHEVVRPGELGDRQLRVRPGEHRRLVLAAQRPELLRPGPVGVVAALPRRHVLRRLQHQQPRRRVPLPHRRHRERHVAAHRRSAAACTTRRCSSTSTARRTSSTAPAARAPSASTPT